MIRKFRETIYNLFPIRRDANMNLIDALSSDGHRCKSVVELSESPHFKRQYSSITDGIADGLPAVRWEETTKAIYQATRNNNDRVILITDCTPQPRISAQCLADRHVTYSPNPAPGNKPICIGHEYSVVAMLPHCDQARAKHWLVPLSTQRVNSDKKGNEVGMHQISDCITQLELSNKLVISLADSKYGTENCRKISLEHPHWVPIYRLNSTRNIYAQAKSKKTAVGNKKRYGKVMKLNDTTTHSDADEVVKKNIVTRSGRRLEVTIKVWNDRLIRGSRQFKGYQHPIKVVQITAIDSEGRPVYKNPLWLGISGARRNEISALEAYEYYDNRYDIEHYFRFGKDKLLFDVYQTPDVAHEEAWWKLTAVAYCQLYLVREHVALLPKKWERYLPSFKNHNQARVVATPSQTQKGFHEILNAIGTPAKPCKRRGNPQGRAAGDAQQKRKKHSILFKKKAQQEAKKLINKGSEKTSNLPESKKIDKLVKSTQTQLKNINCSAEKFYAFLLKVA